MVRRPERRSSLPRKRKKLAPIIAIVLVVAAGLVVYQFLVRGVVERVVAKLEFDASVTNVEQEKISNLVGQPQKSAKVRIETTLAASNLPHVLAAYVPVANVYDVRQSVTKDELRNLQLFVAPGLDPGVRPALADALGINVAKLVDQGKGIPDGAVMFIPANELTSRVKLLALEGEYYLDNFDKGAVFRQVVFEGGDEESLTALRLNEYATKDATLKVNMTGVTALTRRMMTKLSSVKLATYFSEHIGSFLADADITHVSNEVSFKEGCTYHNAVFCSPPSMIEALKASGVDVVELTGNHNNDVGSAYNTETINLYHSLGWGTFGGGLNAGEAAKPYVADQKGSKVAFLGYNYADGVGSGAIARSDTAGANHFDYDRIEADIAAVKAEGAFVIVDIQFWECYAYPDGYVEFPECDEPIPTQASVFRQVADLGADMVVGSSAHQPQTYELYKGTPIYYGLGNLYFDQTQWPGTERGIILTHYFVGGQLVQTKLSPTVYHDELQTRLMTPDEAAYLLGRLHSARIRAGL